MVKKLIFLFILISNLCVGQNKLIDTRNNASQIRENIISYTSSRSTPSKFGDIYDCRIDSSSSNISIIGSIDGRYVKINISITDYKYWLKFEKNNISQKSINCIRNELINYIENTH